MSVVPFITTARQTLSLGRSAALCSVSQSRGEQQVRFEWQIQEAKSDTVAQQPGSAETEKKAC